jgi:predicted glutamine amidotransferase
MCELFAMSARLPSTVSLSLEEFSRHGGLTGTHKDGWGIAWYEDGDVHLRKEALPAASSTALKVVQQHPFSSTLVMCHIRKATQGDIATRNCQPFIRELGGAWHTFAHNGNLTGLRGENRFKSVTFQPVGETDSEQAFCALLEAMRHLWKKGAIPPLSERLKVVTQFAADLRELGPANFLYSDGDVLFAHGHKRHQADGSIRAPGLWQLKRHCTEGGVFASAGLTVEARTGEQDVVLIASVPLSPENWEPLLEGTVLAMRLGLNHH